MKAVVLHQVTEARDVRLTECAIPQVRPGWVLIKVKAFGCKIAATTHRADKLPCIADADEAVVDDGRLTGRLQGITKALDLVGPKHIRDTLTTVEKCGIVCQTGLLGGIYSLNGFDPIKEIPNGVYLTGFFSNYPTQKVMDDIFTFLQTHALTPVLGKAFDLAHIRDAVIAQDEGSVNGKIVVYSDPAVRIAVERSEK